MAKSKGKDKAKGSKITFYKTKGTKKAKSKRKTPLIGEVQKIKKHK